MIVCISIINDFFFFQGKKRIIFETYNFNELIYECIPLEEENLFDFIKNHIYWY